MARVLIADDSAVARVSVKKLVVAAGHEVVEKDTAASAAAVDPSDLACALLDLDLGDGWGTDVAEELRAKHASLPIAFFTTTTTGEALDRARALGPVFAKPSELEDAVAWVRQRAS
jgi:CheY-like chemotaxis protein